MIFKRKRLPEGVSTFLEAAHVAPSHAHLLANGLSGQGVVTNHKMIARSQFGEENWYSLHVRFRFPDGSETEISQGCDRDRIGILEVGDKVPVRYDPDDHSKVVLDLPALETKYQQQATTAEAWRKQVDEERVAKAEAEIDGRVWVPRDPSQQRSDLAAHRMDTRPGLAWAPIAGQLLPIEAAVTAGSGLSVDGAIGPELRQPAQLALAYLASHTGQLLPDLSTDWFSRHGVRVFQPYGGKPSGDAGADAASAGLAIAAAIVSLVGGHVVRTEVALTGGITVDGDLVAVHDLSKKARAAERAYSRRLIAPAANQQPNQAGHADGLEVVFAATIAEALVQSLARHRMKGYIPPV